MKILNRYVSTEFLKPFLYVMIIFAVVVQMGHLFDRLEVFMKNHVPARVVVMYLASMLPGWLVQALPVCTLIAGVTVIGNMATSGEILSLRASGISARQILLPIFMIGAALTVATFFLGDTLMPRATFFAKSLYRVHVDKVGLYQSVWKDVIILARDRKRLTAKVLDVSKNEMEFVTVEEYGEQLTLRQALTAKKAEWTEGHGWTFYDGVVRLFSRDGTEIVEEQPFAMAEIDLPEEPTDLVPQQVEPEELSARQLEEQIKKINVLGIPALREQVHYHLKFAFPFTHLLVLLIGLPVALQTTASGGGRGKKGFGRMKTLSIALLIAFSYFVMIGVGEALGTSRKLPPWLAVWMANFIFAAVGVYLLKKIEQ